MQTSRGKAISEAIANIGGDKAMATNRNMLKGVLVRRGNKNPVINHEYFFSTCSNYSDHLVAKFDEVIANIGGGE